MLTPRDKRQVDRLAKQSEMSVSQVLRAIIRIGLDKAEIIQYEIKQAA